MIFVQPKTRLKQLVCAQQLQRQHDDIFIDALEAVGSRAGSGRRQRCRTRLRCRWRMVRSRGFRRHSSRRGGNGFEFLGVLSNVPASVGTRGARERPTKVSTAAYVGVVSQYIKMFRDLGRPLPWEKTRFILTSLSDGLLAVSGFVPMLFLNGELMLIVVAVDLDLVAND